MGESKGPKGYGGKACMGESEAADFEKSACQNEP